MDFQSDKKDVSNLEDFVEDGVQSERPAYTEEQSKALVHKQDWRIIPLAAFIYLLCFLDRANIGNARVLNKDSGNSLLQETHMTQHQYIIALMVFLIAYAIFEVPSNYFLKKLRPSRWIAFLMFSWGACTIGLGGSKNFATVTAIRFLLGTFEAGLFPGLVYYVTFWYRPEERSLRIATILASATLGGCFGGAIAYGIGHMNQTQGLSAWRWLFILEGIPSCLSSIGVLFLLPDFPETASWLTSDEKEVAKARLSNQGSSGGGKPLDWQSAKATLMDWRLYGHYAIYFALSVPFSSLSLFSPTIISGLGYTSLSAQLMTVPPWGAAYVVTLIIAWSADRTNARAFHSACMAVVAGAGFMAMALLPPTAFSARYGCLIVATSGSFALAPPLLGWLSSNTQTTAAAGLAIALNISFGAPGQIAGVWIYKPNEAKLGYPTGHWTNAALEFFVAAGCLSLRFYYRWRNSRFEKGRDETMARAFAY
ncbi:permease of the major facilitator superfamily [Leptodontidium sp. 2 PMI_412]|nr:permease of the major facilitator superfamily [Leptodontidium sp. 2 PMI_412]